MCDKNLLLVSTIEKYQCLYNSSIPDYMKKDLTEKSWNEVAHQVGLSVAECKEKWRNLRYSLLRSLKPNADGTNKKKYYLHKEMEFLIPYMKTNKGTFVAQFEEEIEDDGNETQEMTSPQQQLFEYEFLAPETTKRKRVEQQIEHFTYSNDLDTRRQFLIGLMPEINALTEEQMKLFRRKVLELLDDITEEGGYKRLVKSEPIELDEHL